MFDWATVNWAVVLPVLGGIVVAIIGGIFLMVRFAGERRIPPPPTWPEMWAEIKAVKADQAADRQELSDLKAYVAERDEAFTGILAEAAEQWPKESPGPVFSQEYLEVLGDTVPHAWRRPSHKFA